MKERIDAILRTLEEAQRQIVDAKANSAGSPSHVATLDAVEAGVNQIKDNLEKLKQRDT